ncbi:MAG: MBL fold metallo-hydrolase [Acidobacteriota bacterium]
MKFLPLGGADDIGASCYYIDSAGTGIILDCGMHPRKTGADALPQLGRLDELPVDAVLITHAHQDHLDALPFLVQKAPHVRIVATPQTRALAELTLHNAAGILQEQYADHPSIKPYTHEEIDLLVQSIEWRSYEEEFEIRGYRHYGNSPVVASFHDAGHILGSAGILLRHGGESLFFTGDISLSRQKILPGCTLPRHAVDTLVLECTHGATDSATLPLWSAEARRLAREANRVFGNRGSVLIPVFALGKMQEMLATVFGLMETGAIPEVPVYTGGLGRKISMVYDKNRFVVPVTDTDIELLEYPQESIFEIQRSDDLFRTPSIVLVSSGMVVEGTTSFTLTKRWLQQKGSAIFTVGYMDPETPGYRLLSARLGSMVRLTESDEPRPVLCDIVPFRFSAHGRREDLLSIVSSLMPKRVILVHGEESAVHWMGNAILEAYPDMKVHAAEIGKEIPLS